MSLNTLNHIVETLAYLCKIFDNIKFNYIFHSQTKVTFVFDSGKTTILYKIKLNETVTTIPTIGFNVETVSPMPGLTFTVWDVGGQERLRQLWHHYYQGTQGMSEYFYFMEMI